MQTSALEREKTVKLLTTLAALIFAVGIAIECQAQRPNRDRNGRRGSANLWEFLAGKYDKNKDGKLTKDEYNRGDEAFARLDRNQDGVITREDTATGSQPRRGQRPSGRNEGALTEGDVAPDFELTHVTDAKQTERLSSFANKKPVALIFGSCT